MKILKRTCLSALLMLISFAVQPKNITDVFVDMPLFLMPTLESSYRLELVENFQENGRDTVVNRFGTTVKLLELDAVNNQITVRSTSSSRFEMQLIELENDTLTAIINTVCAPICSSYIKFYDAEWNEVKVDFPKFSNKSWYNQSISDETRKSADQLVKTSLIEFTFDPAKKVVLVKNNSFDYLSEEDRKSISDEISNTNLEVPFSRLSREKK